MENILSAAQQLMSPAALAAIVLGTVYGTIVGALPGLGSVIAITIVLPFTYSMDAIPSIALVLAIYCSSVYGGSLSAILINTPGTPQSAATLLDGYPMTRKGRAAEAIGWATISSVIGGLFSVAVLIIAAPQLARVALRFGPIETFALICMALTCIAGVSRGSILKGLLAGILGLFLATVGADPMTGAIRFDFGVFNLSAGVSLIPVLVGLFALAEVFCRAAERAGTPIPKTESSGFVVPPFREWWLRKRTLIKSAAIGTFVGILPGTGASTASFIAYSEAKRSGRFRDKFGTGEPEGLIASETSNNAVTGGALVPTLALGIPGDPVTAVVMSTLIIQGIQPGVRLFADNADLMNAAFLALILCNLMLLVVAAAGSRLLTRVLSMPEPVLFTMVVVLSLVGSYGVNGNMFDVLVTFIAGIAGVAFRYIGVPVAPIVIGLVLGPIFEESLRQSLILTDGSFGAFFTLSHPIALGLFALAALLMAFAIATEIRGMQRKPAPDAPEI
ncbi:tripartite tricarboxylate transporter permease [Oceanibium sediminis]|uniref:tripartite tricarboxylate transporter permease n=1 Tax=Oceanibium sediminis TaxID=2026339 RepID=UPI000DD33C03|nr:tripartite tricarboxylate transporter permease [Oceanibium sediminis]